VTGESRFGEKRVRKAVLWRGLRKDASIKERIETPGKEMDLIDNFFN